MSSLLTRAVGFGATLLAVVNAAEVQTRMSSVSNGASSLTLLYQNNLNASDDYRHAGAILLDPMPLSVAAAACNALGESLLPEATIQSHQADFYYSLSYLRYLSSADTTQHYIIGDKKTVSLGSHPTQLYCAAANPSAVLPVLCTQSQLANGPVSANGTAGQVTIAAGGNLYKGFRNLKSFRFAGIPYSNSPGRWEYSSVNSATGQTYNAGQYGPDCPQPYDSNTVNEQCLYLNIQTPHIPKQGSHTTLKPVLFSIHGGGFEDGNGGLYSGEDGGNLASRHDIVSVEINYRLNTLGFLAIPGTDIKGNFGIGDQITALQWVKKNIAAFGGDPNKVTIIGDSAGGASVRALLGSPPVIKDNLIAGAVAQSSLGGGNSLGLGGNYGTPYATYFTVEQSYERAGQDIFQANGCDQTSLDEQIACLKQVPAETLATQPITAQYIVQDGTIINHDHLIVETRNASTAHVPVVFGVCRNDGASIGSTYPRNYTTEAQGISKALGISADYANAVVASGLFPSPNTGNFTLDTFNVSQRIATDITFRCIDEATVYAGAHTGAFSRAFYYEYVRTYEGYDPNNLGLALSRGPVEPNYPNGDPEVPYFNLHSSDLGFTYGNQYPLRDPQDLTAVQLVSGYFAQFTKTGDPNADPAYLRARGYQRELDAIHASGPWEAIQNAKGPAKALSDVSRSIEFPDLAQCTYLNYTIGYYLNGGR